MRARIRPTQRMTATKATSVEMPATLHTITGWI